MRSGFGALLLAGLFGPPAAGQATPPSSVAVVMLGTGMPRPNPQASGPATAILVGDRVFLVDAGPGTERQLAAAGLPIDGVTALFITHLHSDHTLGYPDLILTSWVMGRRLPLRAYGPRGLEAMTGHLIEAWAEDIRIRVEGLEHQTPDGYLVEVSEIVAGVVYEEGGVRVTAIPVPHGSWPEAWAFRFDIGTRAVVVSGDTRPSEALVRGSQGVDLLVHEAYPESRLRPEVRAGGDDWPRYMRAFHTSDRELGALAARIRPRLLVLTHLIRMGGTDEELLRGVRDGGFEGPTVIAKDLDRYEVTD